MLVKFDIDPANVYPNGIGAALPVTTADPNGIAAALPTGTVWTIAGDAEYITASVNSGKSQHIIVTTGADETTPQSTMTLVGTDRDDAAITENLTLPSSSTVVSTKQFKTVDGISVDVATTGVTDVGWIITSWNSAETALWVATTSGDGHAHRMIVTTTGDEPAGADPLLTLTGTDADGRVQTETVTLPNATTVETAKYWLTCTEGSTGANAVAGVFDIGWVDEVASPTIRLGWKKGLPTLYDIDVTGTINVGVEFTLDDLEDDVVFTDQNAYDWTLSESGLAAEVADILTNVTQNYVAARVVVVSYTDTAEVQVRVVQGE